MQSLPSNTEWMAWSFPITAAALRKPCVRPSKACPRCSKRVGGRIPVIVDGGVRRGTDIFKALALGATAVGIGRPSVWGLAAFGQPAWKPFSAFDYQPIRAVRAIRLHVSTSRSGCPSRMPSTARQSYRSKARPRGGFPSPSRASASDWDRWWHRRGRSLHRRRRPR